MEEKTCICIASLNQDGFEFFTRHEYQVDVYPLFFCVYLDGGWNNYIFLNEEDFSKYFQLIS